MNPPDAPFGWTRWPICLLVGLIWAGLYLPGLGTLGLRLEEPRRALPAVQMLKTGDWLVPQLGASPYFRKPPLLNWLIAASFRLTGGRSEWAARLPSVLATLALALTVAGVAGKGWLGREGGLLAALFFLTNITLLETGRLAELEALYLALTGLALTLWLQAWRMEANPWRLWLVPAPFLALAMLTKGPTHLLFYYGILLPVLFRGKNLRILWHPAHWLGLLLVAGAFLGWAIPCAMQLDHGSGSGIFAFWTHQLTSRVAVSEDGSFRASNWLLNLPQGLKNFLPWTLFLPWLWCGTAARRLTAGEGIAPRERALFLGARWGMTAVFLVMSLLPSGSPRYVYPLFIVPCLLLGRIFSLPASEEIQTPAVPFPPSWFLTIWQWINLGLLLVTGLAGLASPFLPQGAHGAVPWITALLLPASAFLLFRFANGSGIRFFPSSRPVLRALLVTSGAMILGTILYAVAVMPQMEHRKASGPRQVAARIRASLPVDALLWVQDRGFCPFWYYLEPAVAYFDLPSEIPDHARYLLLRTKKAREITRNPRWQPPGVTLRTLQELRDDAGNHFILLEVQRARP